MVDLKVLLVEKEDCDAGTVQQIRNGLAEDNSQYSILRDATEVLKKKLEIARPEQSNKLHLKIGLSLFFLGHPSQAIEHLRQADSTLANFYLGRALLGKKDYTEALRAFERAEKGGYTASQVHLQKVAVYRASGNIKEAVATLAKLADMASHSAEYHFQKGCLASADGLFSQAIESFEQAIKLDPGHTGALFELARANDYAGNDDDAVDYYERCLRHPPVHLGTLNNLGVLYEDMGQYTKAVECYRKLLAANPLDAQARLFLKDAQASQSMVISHTDDKVDTRLSQVFEIPVTDFELSVRARNCLKKLNVKTLGDLTRISEKHMMASKNFGEQSLNEIKQMLTIKGLRLGQSLEEGAPTERATGRVDHIQLSEQEQAIYGKPVSELNLSVRARKCMTRLNINTMGELLSKTADELMEARNFGVTSLNEVREKLTIMGVSLRGD
jgi:DNA-directed RNA polymerase subunit alpha